MLTIKGSVSIRSWTTRWQVGFKWRSGVPSGQGGLEPVGVDEVAGDREGGRVRETREPFFGVFRGWARRFGIRSSFEKGSRAGKDLYFIFFPFMPLLQRG